MRCDRFDTLAGHAREIGQSLSVSEEGRAGLLDALRLLARSGYLVSSRDLLRNVREGRSRAERAHITSLVIPTANRVTALERCAASFAANLAQAGRACRLVVGDDSDDAAARRDARASLRRISAASGIQIHYAGQAEKRRFARLLHQRGGVARSAIDFALFDPEGIGFAAGANRNALLLATIGECILSADDDTVCRPEQAEGGSRLKLVSGHEPTCLQLYPTREAVLADVRESEVDVLGAHEELLGKSPAQLLAARHPRDIDVTESDAELVDILETGAGRVRGTWTGFYGDAGVASPLYYAWSSEDVRQQLTDGDENHYRRLLMSREVSRGAPEYRVSNSFYFQAPCVALHGRSLLPPFLPVGRGEDFLFIALLRAIDPSSLLGYVPVKLLHAPLSVRRVSLSRLKRAAQRAALHTCLTAAIAEFGGARHERRGPDTLVALGAHLIACGRLRQREFAGWLADHSWSRMGLEIAGLEGLVARHGGKPAFWARDIEDHVNRMRGSAKVEFLIPRELGGPGDEQGLARTQRLFVRFGEMLCEWPRIVEAATSLREEGIQLAQRL